MASGCHAPVTDNNNAGRSTTDPIRQGIHADQKSSPRAASAIAYSLLLDRHAARSYRASDRGFLLAAETCAPPARSRSHRALDPVATLVSCSIMLHFYSDTEPVRWAPHTQQDATCSRAAEPGVRAPTEEARGLRRHRALARTLTQVTRGLWADTHTPVHGGP
jgi:hypothetical protein